VLSGGELGAAVIVDTITRLIPGRWATRIRRGRSRSPEPVAGQAKLAGDGRVRRAFPAELLDYPHYTRPAEYRGMAVPEVLVNGKPRPDSQLAPQNGFGKTLRNRPDLLEPVRAERGRQGIAGPDQAGQSTARD